MLGFGGLTAAVALMAQDLPPANLLRGSLIEWEGTPGSGELSFRGEDHRVHRCTFDEKTYAERDNQRVPIGDILPADRLEMVWDRTGAPPRCYVRTLHVTKLSTAPASRPRLAPHRMVTEHIAPRGNVTLAGVVVRLLPESVVIRTRADGDKLIHLRRDTRYLESGAAVDAQMLRVNARVFVRAGKTSDNEIEAFQIVWGEILPRR